MEFESEGCDYDEFGDTRNRKGKIEEGYSKHNKGYKEQKRIFYIKEKRLMQSLADRGLNEKEEDSEEIDNSKKRKLKKINEEDKNYGNNYTPIEHKNKKKKNSKKDKIRF